MSSIIVTGEVDVLPYIDILADIFESRFCEPPFRLHLPRGTIADRGLHTVVGSLLKF
ncbi:MAG TPA: hypothetical protein PKA63_05500 [Oligoflexia bacterium]|nr:hypothetical protein [Oligoflexia bacterium]HMP48104.1 hypothetical protein [Oligoflexia bacterium]